jgi:hypothetical protein
VRPARRPRWAGDWRIPVGSRTEQRLVRFVGAAESPTPPRARRLGSRLTATARGPTCGYPDLLGPVGGGGGAFGSLSCPARRCISAYGSPSSATGDNDGWCSRRSAAASTGRNSARRRPPMSRVHPSSRSYAAHAHPSLRQLARTRTPPQAHVRIRPGCVRAPVPLAPRSRKGPALQYIYVRAQHVHQALHVPSTCTHVASYQRTPCAPLHAAA